MKKLLIALGVLLLLCIIGLGIAAYSAESLVKKYKPDLEQIASDALKAPVALGDIGVSVFDSGFHAEKRLSAVERHQLIEYGFQLRRTEIR